MTEKDKLIKELILNNPKVSATNLYDTKIKGNKTLGKRKSDFLKIVREVRKLPEPSKQKREQSIPIKHRIKRKPRKREIKPKEPKEPKEPKKFKDLTDKEIKEIVKTKQEKFEKSKFGRIVKKLEKKHGISELDAIERTRGLLKIPKRDLHKAKKKDREVLSQFGY